MAAQHEGREQVEVRPAPARPITVTITPRTIWLAAGIAVGLAMLWLLLSRGLSVLILLFVAIVFAEGIRPLVDRLSRIMPRGLAVMAIYLVLLTIAAALLYLLGQPVANQATSLVQNLPHYITRLQVLIQHWERSSGASGKLTVLISQARSEAISALHGFIPVLISTPFLILGLLFDGLTILFMAFFWLTAIDPLKGWVVSLLPPGSQQEGADIIAELGERLGGYVRGVALNMIIAGVAVWIALSLLGVPYATLLGVLAGLTNLIPIIGTYVAAAAGILMALVTEGVLKAGEVWLFYLLFQEFQGAIISTYVMKRTVDLNQLTTLVATLLGGVILGVVGAVIAVPLAVVVEVLVRRVLVPAVRRATGNS